MRLLVSAVAAAVAVAGQALAETCTFEVPSNPNKVYDLTPLSGRDFHVPSAKGDFEFHLSVCGPLADPPKECEAVTKKHRVAAAQVSRGGFCFYLGRADEPSVRIEDGDAELGFDLVYSSGEPCSDGRRREVRYHFICAERYEAHVAPHFVVETPEKCHYNVTWPSRYGCPVDRSSWSWWAATGRHGDPNQATARKGAPQQSVEALTAGNQKGGVAIKGTPPRADTAGAHAGAHHPELVYGLGLPQLELWGGWTFWDVLIWSPVAAAVYMVLGFAYNAGATAGGLDDAGVFGGEDDLEGLAMDATDDLDLFRSELEADERRAGNKSS
ncbi:hypothetical protein FNF29_02967 [Cafeteria roenbergensis]|uniref:MRH domain-containing protein n=1 Tax=Cafeteria roenbergensis TaxID=33653 RepID=A0A5A8DD83_CAFRO|nr:hypothetical protein FNF29_02967 [Cafeteria roenbergensis]KAA0162564.1 hypothetical protein FNF28_04657 [Cafeteria roenbergensis]|eukprot:KAA0153579.1 hypothetical protein FNF29_02967 [Cafeteria roenbergensis]